MIEGVLLDIAGVLHEGGEVVPGAPEAVMRLRKAGLPVRFLTNTTRRPKRHVVEQLNALDMEARPDEVFTPVSAALDWLDEHGRAPHLLVHPDLEAEFAGCRTDGNIAVVIGDAGNGFTYDRLNAAFRALADGAPFLALAANRVFKDADGRLSLDAGAFVKALEFSSGNDALLLGKPSAGFFHAAIDSMGVNPGAVAMVGDDAESDIAGALSAGVGTGILVRTGKYRTGDETRFRPEPTATVADIGEAIPLILGG